MLLIFGLVDISQIVEEQTTWDAIQRHTLSRLPVTIPLIWVALYAGRHYSLALRLQEDYAYKEAISTAFEGYRKEMGGITGTADRIPLPFSRKTY